jgi:hypothetical protein
MPPKKKLKKKSNGSLKKSVSQPTVPVTLPPLALVDTRVSALNYSVVQSDKKSIRRLIEAYNYSEVLNKVDGNGSTPLHVAAKLGDENMLKTLLSYRAIDINQREFKEIGGFAAIHYACSEGNDRALKLLCEAGADVNLKCDNAAGETPLHLCCRLDQRKCGRVLRDAGALPDARNNFGHNPAFWALSKQNNEIVKELDLPAAKAATAEEYLKLILQRNSSFVLPAVSKKSKKDKAGKSAKKKGKK